ncbi:hypothetical protein B0O99DRAFT_395401 [Bisporella sp. PMI_857]|nr:hypothetical protein B0O99DRAFT_395401 [Bisporella sp. PMI_857]
MKLVSCDDNFQCLTLVVGEGSSQKTSFMLRWYYTFKLSIPHVFLSSCHSANGNLNKDEEDGGRRKHEPYFQTPLVAHPVVEAQRGWLNIAISRERTMIQWVIRGNTDVGGHSQKSKIWIGRYLEISGFGSFLHTLELLRGFEIVLVRLSVSLNFSTAALEFLLCPPLAY